MRLINDRELLDEYAEKLKISERLTEPAGLGAVLAEFDAGELLYMAGERLEYLYFVAEGRLHIYSVSEDGRRYTAAYEDAPAFLGDAEFMLGVPSVNNVEAALPLRCLLLPFDRCRERLRDDLLFYRFISGVMAEKLIGSGQSLKQSRAYPLERRLAEYLLARGGELRCLGEASDALDVSYRHLLRCLGGLCRRGVLERSGRGEYRTPDIEALRRCAGR